VLCRSNDWGEIVTWVRAEIKFLSSILALPNGIPSADTFARVFSRINPRAFEACFVEWMAAVAGERSDLCNGVGVKAAVESYRDAGNQ